MSKLLWLTFAVACFLNLSSARAEESPAANSLEIVGMDKLATELKLASFKQAKFNTKVKIAVFDNGFWHYEDHLGKLLPASTICYSNSEIPNQQCKDEYKEELKRSENAAAEAKPFHGLLMAEIITQILARAGNSNYQIDLFRTNGLDRLTRAIKHTVEQKYDIIVYSEVWEFGGFGDGKGFVNAAVNEAVNNGIIWINSAGNFGRLMRAGPVETGREGWVSFKNAKGKTSDSVSIRCTLSTPCNLRLVLSWNDYKDDPEIGTDKQLNLYLFDEKNVQIAASEKIQMLNPPMDDLKYSKLPRQMIKSVQLEPDTAKKPKRYSVKVKNISNNFNASTDKLKIMASGIGIEVLDPSLGETILPPADNPGVIDIGASDDPNASSSRSLKLPRIYLKSMIELKNGLKPFESSTAAAMAGAMAALYVGSGTEKTRDAVEKKLMSISKTPLFALPSAAGEDANNKKIVATPSNKTDATAGARPVARVRSPRYAPPLKRPQPGGVRAAGAAGAAYANGTYATQQSYGCLIPALPQITDPYLARQLANLISLGGAATVINGGRVTVAVYFDLARQFGLYGSGPYTQVLLTAQGVVAASPEQMHWLEDQQVIPVIQTSIPVCE